VLDRQRWLTSVKSPAADWLAYKDGEGGGEFHVPKSTSSVAALPREANEILTVVGERHARKLPPKEVRHHAKA
jgi:hypothetical protein